MCRFCDGKVSGIAIFVALKIKICFDVWHIRLLICACNRLLALF